MYAAEAHLAVNINTGSTEEAKKPPCPLKCLARLVALLRHRRYVNGQPSTAALAILRSYWSSVVCRQMTVRGKSGAYSYTNQSGTSPGILLSTY